MKKITKVVLITWFWAALPFAVCAFIKFELDVSQWQQETREVVIFASIFCGTFAGWAFWLFTDDDTE